MLVGGNETSVMYINAFQLADLRILPLVHFSLQLLQLIVWTTQTLQLLFSSICVLQYMVF